MAVGNTSFPEMHRVKGIRLGTTLAGIKQNQRDDLLLIEMVEAGRCAAVFTRNAFCAAPVHVAKKHLADSPRWLLVNSGNANAGTGQQGMDDALTCCQQVAKQVGGLATQVLPFSTGVIGENLPLEKMLKAVPETVADLSEQHWHKAAQAIMTTDTVAKGASEVIDIDGQSLTITGIAKGSGMIHPNMATMLSFIATDACIAQPLLQRCLQQAVDQSFNRITVDGDTSTNDACVLLATGCSSVAEIREDSTAFIRFCEALNRITAQLAEAIIRDGEGATKLIRIVVEQALTDEEALQLARTIALSPLVKTAFFASDPNWGRILAAVGRAGVQNLDIDRVKIYLGDICIVEAGGRAPSYTEQAGQAVMDKEEITVRVVLGRGQACQRLLTCDLSYDYVRINAEYRT